MRNVAHMREINSIVIHCAATKNGVSLFQASPGGKGTVAPVNVIDGWHKARKFKRTPEWRRVFNPTLESIGYHYVIYLNGAIATGRHLDEVGAHVAGANSKTIGICLVGTDKFTAEQWASLRTLIGQLKAKWPAAKICGHRDYSPDKNGNGIVEPWEWLKTCPGFDVATWLSGDLQPLRDHLLEVKP